MPEALRVKGGALLLSDKADTTPAEDHFRRSLDLARRRGAPWRCHTRVAAALVISPVQSDVVALVGAWPSSVKYDCEPRPVSLPDDAIAKNLRSVP